MAKDLRGTKDKALTTLSGARMRMKLAGATGEEERLAARCSASSATARAPAQEVRRRPEAAFVDDQVPRAGRGRRLSCSTGKHVCFVLLGPPRDARLIGQSAPSKSGDQVYGDTALKFGAYGELLG